MRLFKTTKYEQLVIVGSSGRVGHLPVRGPVDQFSGCSSLHVIVSLGKTVRPELPLIHPLECECVNFRMCLGTEYSACMNMCETV